MVKKRKDGLIEKTVTVNGKRIHFYGKTNKEVYDKIAEYKEKKATISFTEVADEWWSTHMETIAYNTTKGYKPAYERAVNWFGDDPVSDIAPVDISKELRNMAKKYADKTIRTQLLVINLIFKYAVEVGYVPANPARDLSAPTGLGKRKVTSPEAKDIVAIKKGLSATFGLFAYMALYTGMRKGELLALTYEDIDLKNRVINVNKSLYHESNVPKVKTPKTAASATYIPILDALLPHIPKKKHGIVFANDKGEYMSETQFQRQWELYTKETGVTCTPHQLRHCFATMLFEADVPPEKAQRLLRHANLSTTIDIYTDLRVEKQKEIFKDVYDIDIH